MKSGKQRRLEIKNKRLIKAEKRKRLNKKDLSFYITSHNNMPVDETQLAHVCLCRALPAYYQDICFTCRACGKVEIWTARAQKWWYESMKGHIDSTAVYCRPCRKAIRAEKAAQKEHMRMKALEQPHPNEAFFRKSY